MRSTTSAAVLVAAFALGIAACSDESTEPEATTDASTPATVGETSPGPSETTLDSSRPTPTGTVDVFSFAEDDLCEWVSGADVAEWIAAEFDVDGTATEVATDREASCAWTLVSADADFGIVRADDAALWRGFSGSVYDLDEAMANAGVTQYPTTDGDVGIGAFVVGHPAVSEGVVVHYGGFGQFAFGVPPGPWLQVSFESDRLDDDLDPDEYEARYFAVADRFLQALGWVPARGDTVAPTGP